MKYRLEVLALVVCAAVALYFAGQFGMGLVAMCTFFLAFAAIVWAPLPYGVRKYINKYRNAIVISFLLSTTTVLSLVGSIFPTYTDSKFSIPVRFFMTVNDTGILFVPLIVAIVLSTVLFNDLLSKVNAFVYYKGGLIDPVTGEENICLRIQTFCLMLAGLDLGGSKDLGKKIGSNFCINLFSSYSNQANDINDFAHKWAATDEKTGFFEHIEMPGLKDDTTISMITLQIKNSFCKKDVLTNKPNHKTNLCSFFLGYIEGVVSEYYNQKYPQKYALEVVETDKCRTCVTTRNPMCEISLRKSDL